jgi:hypothetical protein
MRKVDWWAAHFCRSADLELSGVTEIGHDKDSAKADDHEERAKDDGYSEQNTFEAIQLPPAEGHKYRLEINFRIRCGVEVPQ